MVKKIGKLFMYQLLVLSFVCQIFAQQELIFKALSRDGDSLENIAVGNRFILEVRLRNFNREGDVVIENLDKNIKLLSKNPNRSQITKIVNNNRTDETIYQYAAIAEKVGSFKIGPAVCNNVQSNTIRINVVDFIEPADFQSVGVNLILDLQIKDDIFVGQTVPFMLSVDDSINPTNLTFPDSPDYKFSNIKRVEVKSELFTNKICWIGKITFLNSKNISILPIELDYEVPTPEQNFFSVFWGRDFNKKREKIYSNSLDIFIHQLPKTSDVEFQNCPVGEFKNFKINLSNDIITTDKAASLIISIKSKDANLNLVNYSLKNMPTELKIYESNVSVQEDLDFCVKKFEYIVQPTSDGEFTIPAQYFAYFDIVDKKYKKLKVDALKLQVNISEINNIIPQEVLEERENIKYDFKDIILWQNYKIDWWIVIFLILLAAFIIFYQELCATVFQISILISLFVNKYFINFYTKIRLIRASKKLDSMAMILAIENYLAVKLNMSTNFVFDLAEKKMFSLGVSKEKILLFNNFITKLADNNFGFNPVINKAKFKHLYSESIDWIKYLNKIFKVFLIACTYIFSLSAVGEVEDIVHLRKMQIGNTYSNFEKIEVAINAIKESAGVKPINLYSETCSLLYKIFGVVPLLIWQVLLILYWWIFCLFAIIKRHLSNKYKIGLLIIGLILFIPAAFLNKLNNYAVVKNEKALIYFGPGLDYPFVSRVGYLQDVSILKVKDKWSQVGFNGNVGWIESSSIERI